MSNVTEIRFLNIPELKGPSIYERIYAGDILVIRDVPEVQWIADLLGMYEQCSLGTSSQSVIDFIDEGETPTIQNIYVLRNFIRRIRSTHSLSGLFSSFIKQAAFPDPVVLDVGLARLVFPDPILNQIQQRRDLFPPEDFHSPRFGALEEVFYTRKDYGQPHREFDSPHSAMQTHLWFPLHDISEEESLLIFPDAYHDDIAVDQGKKDQPPETWGLGSPLRIPLKKGDMIIFHSEHIHASPFRNGETFRWSYDFRIVSNCPHDHGWHHHEFWNLNNFMNQANELCPNQCELELFNSEEKEITPFNKGNPFQMGMSYMNYCRKWGQDMASTEIDEVFQINSQLPFCEDRYIALASLFKLRTPHLARQAFQRVIDSSKSYYWMARASEGLLSLAETETGLRGLEKAIDAANCTELNYNHNPTPYSNGRHIANNEPNPASVLNRLHSLRERYQTAPQSVNGLDYSFTESCLGSERFI